MNNVFVVLILILFFGLSIFVHELGHYIVARMCGLVVEVFSIGFGPAIWKKKIGGTVYKIGCLPIGGYVALPQLDPAGMRHIQSGQGEGDGASPDADDASGQVAAVALPRIAPWRKILVSLAGAFGNVVLAVIIAWLVFWIGMPAGPAERSSVVGYVMEDSLAYEAGLRVGDHILAVNEKAVSNWNEFAMEAALNERITVHAVSPAGDDKVLDVATESGVYGEQSVLGVVGIDLPAVLTVDASMSAAKAGIRAGDLITHFAGQPVYSKLHLIDIVHRHKGETVSVTVKRTVDGETTSVSMPVTPEYDPATDQVRIGIRFNAAAVERDTVVHPTPSAQLKHHATAIVRMLRALVTPTQAKAASNAVGGPVAIVVSYWYIVKTSVMLAVWFTGFLNVNLAIINLLPIPVLDGGHIVFSLWEMITRRPVHARVVNGLVNIFMVLLMGLFLMLTVRDVDRFTRVGSFIRNLFTSSDQASGESMVMQQRVAVATNGVTPETLPRAPQSGTGRAEPARDRPEEP